MVDIDNAPDTYIRSSSIEGQGLFASKDFKEGDIILDYRPWIETFIKTEWRFLNQYQIDHNWFIPVDDDYCLTSDLSSKIYYVNHSKEPNGNWFIKDLLIIANKDIKKDEEITIDYRLEYRPTRKCWPAWI